MKLIDLLAVIDENIEFVNVYIGCDMVAAYNGKDSIDPAYNEHEVRNVYAGRYGIGIEVWEKED